MSAPPKPLREAAREAAEALEHALEWLAEEGCDCGTPPDQPCALCEAGATLAKLRAVLEPSK